MQTEIHGLPDLPVRARRATQCADASRLCRAGLPPRLAISSTEGLSNATQEGYLQCLKYAHKMALGQLNVAAAAHGSFYCLKYNLLNDCPHSEKVVNHVASMGSLDCVRYARHTVVTGTALCWRPPHCSVVT